MTIIHLIMAIFATTRLVEILTQERISQGFRQRFPIYLWTCPRCVSVWAGIVSTISYYYFPWILWPFALSSISILMNLIVQTWMSRVSGVRR